MKDLRLRYYVDFYYCTIDLLEATATHPFQWVAYVSKSASGLVNLNFTKGGYHTQILQVPRWLEQGWEQLPWNVFIDGLLTEAVGLTEEARALLERVEGVWTPL